MGMQSISSINGTKTEPGRTIVFGAITSRFYWER